MLEANRTVTIPQQLHRSNKKLVVTGNPIYDQYGEIVLVITVVKPAETGHQNIDFNNIKKESAKYKIINNMVMQSTVMQEVVQRAAKIAGVDSNVVVTGESGVGKELIAKSIHDFSSRKEKPFITVNTAAIPDNLIESELFGHVRGAYTGSNPRGSQGFVKAARGGTLFLDEISEIPLNMQAKLLRLLEQKEIIPVGSNRVEEIDVRIICATNRNLVQMMQSGHLRKDLYYRINVFNIDIPPLRERKEDISALAYFFLDNVNKRFKTNKFFSCEAIELLEEYSWPGNVREFKNIMERLILLYQPFEIKKEHVESELSSKYEEGDNLNSKLMEIGGFNEAVSSFEKELIRKKLRKYSTIEACAQSLGIHRTTLLRKMKRYNISY